MQSPLAAGEDERPVRHADMASALFCGCSLPSILYLDTSPAERRCGVSNESRAFAAQLRDNLQDP